MQYTVQCINKFFRMLRSHGAWVPQGEKLEIARYGQDFAETCLHDQATYSPVCSSQGGFSSIRHWEKIQGRLHKARGASS